MISMEIIDTLQRGLSKEQVWSDVGYVTGFEGDTEETLKSLTNASAYCKAESGWHKEDEILDDSWVQQSRKEGPATSHLDGLNWEVLVVNDSVVNAILLPGGKIVVYNGLLEHFKSDAEIATIIGHEVGHAVARHIAEGLTKNSFFFLEATILSTVAPTVYQKLGEVNGDSALMDYFSTHPSGRKRARLLSQAKIMEEASTIYKNARSGRSIEGFL
ncbi:hypothetical protein AHAS_Ahas17G0268300 [Arachis hypogaea]|uniref:Peptidase M48 domain-containing protein n=1 Tax=Arachis hypogaea TaxID=3818 RepID=A0A445CAH9_ARAHY|nr:hypothetical protein Ahy_A07g033896 isoform C [Arachis hypogaea]